METVNQLDYVWMQNPDGRKVEVHQSSVKELLERGFKVIGEDQTPLPDMESEILEVIEL